MKKHLFFFFIVLYATAGAQQPPTIVHIKTKTSADYNGVNSTPEIAQAFSQDLAQQSEIYAFQKDSMRKYVLVRGKITFTQVMNDASGGGMVLVQSPDEQCAYIQTAADRKAHEAKAIMAMHTITVSDQANRRSVMNQSVQTAKLVYSAKEKTVNNISCKKVMVVNLNEVGDEREIEAWYTTGYEWVRNGLLKNSAALGYAGIDGLVIKYKDTSTISLAGTDMLLTYQYEIKKIDTAAAIDNSVFEIPAGFAVKTWAEYMEKYPKGIPFTAQPLNRRIVSQPAKPARGPSSLVPRNF